MPVINVISRQDPVSVISIDSTTHGDSITSSLISGSYFISEDVSRQIITNNLEYVTSFTFLSLSLMVYINGVKLSAGFDYSEDIDLTGFTLIQLDTDFDQWLGPNSCITVSYIKRPS